MKTIRNIIIVSAFWVSLFWGVHLLNARTLSSADTPPRVQIDVATGALVAIQEDSGVDTKGELILYKFNWTAASSGTCTATIKNLRGMLFRIFFKPGTCSDLYNITFDDFTPFDVFNGLGANLSNVTATNRCAFVGDGTNYIPQTLYGDHILHVTNAGNAGTGSVYMWIKR